jgi:hypothetical protein
MFACCWHRCDSSLDALLRFEQTPQNKGRKLSAPIASSLRVRLRTTSSIGRPHSPKTRTYSRCQFRTSGAFVETATKCLAIDFSSFPRPTSNHARAVWAFVIVSNVVNVFEETKRASQRVPIRTAWTKFGAHLEHKSEPKRKGNLRGSIRKARLPEAGDCQGGCLRNRNAGS